ncbi:hypothetical protein OIDMADRAFT_55762 [Oidiodendron maius Zn]|uniref:Peptidase S8/S53 domain-containing protein n=1 Tax=Oidiodendron maius (strain Zn) TaxID=913774 RepID=A0A0C3GUV5_OIDMZ|nr:hypothetical protein OIDMADRAFT_55762 [Oidiodendron maius Zn]
MFRLLTSSLAAVFTCTSLAQAFSNLTINGNSSPNNTLYLQPNTQYTVSFDTTNDDSNSQWAALLVLEYVSPVPGTRPLMPVCVLAGGLETSTIGSDATDNTISFILDLPPLVVPSSILAGVEVGELTSDGVVLLSTLFTLLGDRLALTSVESAGVPLDLVETLCSDYAATINSTAPVCIGGSGPDNYADVCNFACSNGFCPSPCSCTSTGTGNSPTPADASITGSAAPGLDSTTFDPLCNFACARGFCPDGVCDESVDFTSTTPDLPAMTILTPFETTPVSYSAGDYFEYENPSDPEFNLALYLIGAETTWDDIDCGVDAAEGPDGDTLGCIAVTVAWLVYSIYLYEGFTSDGVLASSTTTRSQTSSHAHFQVHSEWQPEDNCTTHCLLLARAPFDTWIPIGNGTYNGIFHELHFIHNEKMFGHRAFQGSSSGDLLATGTLAPRRISYKYGKPLVITRYGGHLTYKWLDDKENAILNTEFVGESYENAVASSDYAAFCEEIRVGATMEIPTLTTFGQNGAALESSEEAFNNLQACNNTINEPASYVVWPVDRTNTDAIQKLLDSLGGVGYETITSLVDGLVLFWKIQLKPSDVTTVSDHPQVQNIELECFDNCGDWDFTADANDEFNATAEEYFEKRDTGFNTVLADDDLCFISTPQGTTIDGYYYFDTTLGLGVPVYLIDESYDLAHSDFLTTGLSVVQSVAIKAFQASATPGQYTTVIGTMGTANPGHGTCMLDQIAGFKKGVAPNIMPVLFNLNVVGADRSYFIKTLDAILADYNKKKASGGLATPLAVLSMSFSWPPRSYDGWENAAHDRLNKLVEAGILPVASGNWLRFPAAFANPALTAALGVPGLLAVGAVDNSGNRFTGDAYSTGSNYIDYALYAPGAAAKCAEITTVGGQPASVFAPRSGTSIATAKTAGLAAYFIGLSSLWPRFAPGYTVGGPITGNVLALKQYILEQSYARTVGFPAVFNGAPVRV